MTDQRDPNQVTDAGTPPPADAGAQPMQPQAGVTDENGVPSGLKSTDSNAPQADTPAGASIPKNMVNDPQVPSQKMATQVDLNKTSPAPHHTWLYKAAQELSGGPVYKTRYDSDGNAIREQVPVSPAHLGLALAAELVKGGIAGGSAKTSVEAAQAGGASVAADRAQAKKAQTDQDAQAKADQTHKLDVTEANMRNYQTAVASAKSGIEAASAYSDSFKDIADGLENHTFALPEGTSVGAREWETDAQAAIKNGKSNITKDLLIPVGDPKPVLGANGQQVFKNGVPQFGHDYLTVHGVGPDGKIPLSDKMQSDFVAAGIMPEIPEGGIGKPEWSLADIAKKTSTLASINAGEEILQQHKNDMHDYLGLEPEDLDDLKAAVKSDPRMSKAVQLFAQAQQGATSSSLDDIFRSLDKVNPGLSGTLKNYLHITQKNLDDMTNKRLQEHTEAAKEKQVQPLTPEGAENVKAQTEERRALGRKADADAVLARKQADALSSGGKMPDGSWNMNSTPVALVEGDMVPTQLSKRSSKGQYEAQIESANKYSMEKYGVPFDMTKAESDYAYSKQSTNQNVLKLVNGVTAPGGSLEIAANAAKQLPRFDEQTVNKIFNVAKTEFGSDTASTFHTAMLGLADEYAKILGGGTATVAGTDMALGILKDAYSKGQLAGAVETIRKDIAARKNGIVGDNRYLIRDYGAPGAVKFGGKYIPKSFDGTYHIRGSKYIVSPDGKSLTPAGGK